MRSFRTPSPFQFLSRWHNQEHTPACQRHLICSASTTGLVLLARSAPRFLMAVTANREPSQGSWPLRTDPLTTSSYSVRLFSSSPQRPLLSFRLLVPPPNYPIGKYFILPYTRRADEADQHSTSLPMRFSLLSSTTSLHCSKKRGGISNSQVARGCTASGLRRPFGSMGYVFSFSVVFHLPSQLCDVRRADIYIFINSCCKVKDGIFAYEVNGTFSQFAHISILF